jgi:ribosomal protein S18 acetylase RimI-like enzyme
MHIRPAKTEDQPTLVGLMAAFRAALSALRGEAREPDEAAAERELREHERDGSPVFVAAHGERLVGYLLCRVDGRTVWAEQLYVRPEHRRRGVASALYGEAERLAEQRGGRTVFNWIHPNNDAIVAFLKARGYDVLNLVEVRRPAAGENPAGTIRVGDHAFRY